MTVLDAYVRVRDLRSKGQIMTELKKMVMEELKEEENEPTPAKRSASSGKTSDNSSPSA